MDRFIAVGEGLERRWNQCSRVRGKNGTRPEETSAKLKMGRHPHGDCAGHRQRVDGGVFSIYERSVSILLLLLKLDSHRLRASRACPGRNGRLSSSQWFLDQGWQSMMLELYDAGPGGWHVGRGSFCCDDVTGVWNQQPHQPF